MTDTRELLELAAKATGKELWWDYEGGVDVCRGTDGNLWNPLTNPGDCADMEEKLSIDVVWCDTEEHVFSRSPGTVHCSELYFNHPNRQAARMMASTRCAAEVARRMG